MLCRDHRAYAPRHGGVWAIALTLLPFFKMLWQKLRYDYVILNHSLTNFSFAKPLLLGQVVRPLKYLPNKPIRIILSSILSEIRYVKILPISLEKSLIEQDSILRPFGPRSRT